MKNKSFVETNQIKLMECFSFLAVSLLICSVISGCTVNRVSILAPEPTGTPIKASEVKFFPSFKDMGKTWRLEGMISAYTLPIMSNSAEKREMLVRNTVAGLGINAVVGLQSNIGEGVGRTGHSNGILANIGTVRQKDAQRMPKFIVCLPPVSFKTEKDASMNKLDDYLREQIQYFFSYTRGYYVYRCDLRGVSNASILQGSILQGSIDSAFLGEPLGIAPDYALLCDVDGYDEKGNIVVNHSQILKITMMLFDLQEKKIVWITSTTGMATTSLLRGFLTLGLTGVMLEAGNEPDDLRTVREAIMNAMDTVPIVNGFQGGTISPIDRK